MLESAIAVSVSRCCWSTIFNAGGESSGKPSLNMRRKALLQLFAARLAAKAARAGPHSDASALLSVMNVVVAGPV